LKIHDNDVKNLLTIFASVRNRTNNKVKIARPNVEIEDKSYY